MPSTWVRGLEPGDDLGGRADPDVGRQQDRLDVVPGLVVETVARQHREAAHGPSVDCDWASRPRSRCSRPAVGSGPSWLRLGLGLAVGASDRAGRPAAVGETSVASAAGSSE